eukprot:2306534-Amphidinium_carterae.1
MWQSKKLCRKSQTHETLGGSQSGDGKGGGNRPLLRLHCSASCWCDEGAPRRVKCIHAPSLATMLTSSLACAFVCHVPRQHTQCVSLRALRIGQAAHTAFFWVAVSTTSSMHTCSLEIADAQALKDKPGEVVNTAVNSFKETQMKSADFLTDQKKRVDDAATKRRVAKN